MSTATQTLVGDRICLRTETAADIPAIVKWFSDPEVVHWLHLSEMPPATTESETAKLARHQADPARHDWIIETLDGDPIGSASLTGVDDVHLRAELGISIGEKEYWSHGYGTEAIGLILRHAFDDLGMNRVTLIADADNDRAIRCYAKSGFRFEGILRGHRLRNGKPLDMVAMGVLADEYDSSPIENKGTCPRCKKSDRVVPYVYGEPSIEAVEESERDEIMLAGCLVGPTDATFHCKRCELDFGLVGR